MIVSGVVSVNASLHDVELRSRSIKHVAAFAQHRIMHCHLPRPNADAGANVCDVIDTFEAVFDELANQPIESFYLFEVLSSLSIKRMLKGCRRKTFQRNSRRFWNQSGIIRRNSRRGNERCIEHGKASLDIESIID